MSVARARTAAFIAARSDQAPATSIVSTQMPPSHSGARAPTSFRRSSHRATSSSSRVAAAAHSSATTCIVAPTKASSPSSRTISDARVDVEVATRLGLVVEAQHRRARVALQDAPTRLQPGVEGVEPVGRAGLVERDAPRDQGGLGDDAQGALGPDEQADQVRADRPPGRATPEVQRRRPSAVTTVSARTRSSTLPKRFEYCPAPRHAIQPPTVERSKDWGRCPTVRPRERVAASRSGPKQPASTSRDPRTRRRPGPGSSRSGRGPPRRRARPRRRPRPSARPGR